MGIKEGDIQRGGPPPYSLAMHTLSSECYMLAPWYFERRGGTLDILECYDRVIRQLGSASLAHSFILAVRLTCACDI